MTATPRIYGRKLKESIKDTSIELCSMDNEEIFGPVFYTLNFGNAVTQNLLSDYKVIVLVMDEASIENSVVKIGSSLDYVAKIVGCYKALVKINKEIPTSIKRVIAFCGKLMRAKNCEKTL